jgi:uncharacterized membrane protein YhaH (DUF805 family)
MTFIRALFSFSGRIGRVEYLFCMIVYCSTLAVFLLGELIVRRLGDAGVILLLLPLIALMLWILFASMAKRFHDFRKTGWSCLLVFVPVVGPMTLFIILFYPGDVTDNLYGPARKGYFR